MKAVSERSFLRVLNQTIDPNRSFWWPSRYLKTSRVIEAARAIEIVQQIGEPGSAILSEMERALGNISQILEPSFWDSYFRAYDLLVSFNHPYRELLQLAHRHLPLSGKIMDLGSGTGNFSLALAAWGPNRAFALVDQSQVGLDLAASKFRVMGSENEPLPRLVKRSLLDEAAFPECDGAVLNNVLYSIPAVSDKKAILERVYRSLSAGGAFFLNDPLPTTSDAAYFRQSFLHLILGAVTQHSPMTEFDLAVLAVANLRLGEDDGKSDQSHFLSCAEIETLAQETGFKVENTRPTYAGISQTYFLRK